MTLARLLLAAILVGLPLHAATVLAEPFPPAAFTSLYIERDDKDTSTSVQLAGDAIIYKVIVDNKILENVTVHPSGDDWFKFIQGLNAAKAYKWAPKYYYPGQGPTWVIDLAMSDRTFTSGGTNEFPLNGDEANPKPAPDRAQASHSSSFGRPCWGWSARLRRLRQRHPQRNNLLL